MIKKGEIVYCNLTVIQKDRQQILKEVVYKEIDGYYKNQKVINIDIIKRLGFENGKNGYTVGHKNDDQRNKITGAYE